MSSQEFEHIKSQYPRLAPLLDRMITYIGAQTADGQEYIIPKLAAAALRLTDGEAFILLQKLAEAGVLQRVYNVYCRKNNALLATVDNLDALDGVAYCDFCGCEHDPSDLKVEIAFRPAKDGLKDRAA
jgi:hypothetical protein